MNSANSLEENSCHGDWKTPITTQAPPPVVDIEDIPSKTPGMNPTRVLITTWLSRKALREECHSTLFSKKRNILKPSRGIF